MSKFEGYGETDKKGIFKMYSKEQLVDFFRQNQNKRIMFQYSVVNDKGAQKQRGYYWAQLIPRFKDKLVDLGYEFYEDNDVHVYIMQFAMSARKKNGDVMSSGDVDFPWSKVIEELKRFAAQNIDLVIE